MSVRWLSYILLLLVILSSMVVVGMRHMNRVAFVEQQRMEAERDALNLEWGQLTIQQSFLARPDRVRNRAVGELGMQVPPPKTSLDSGAPVVGLGQ